MVNDLNGCIQVLDGVIIGCYYITPDYIIIFHLLHLIFDHTIVVLRLSVGVILLNEYLLEVFCYLPEYMPVCWFSLLQVNSRSCCSVS